MRAASLPPFSLSIHSESGMILYSTYHNMPAVGSSNYNLMLAFCMTGDEEGADAKVITTKSGFIAYTNLDFRLGGKLYICYAQSNLAKTSERTLEASQRVLYMIRNLLIAHIGIRDFDEDLKTNNYIGFDRLKK